MTDRIERKKGYFYVLAIIGTLIFSMIIIGIVYIFYNTFPNISKPSLKKTISLDVQSDSSPNILNFTNNVAYSLDPDGKLYFYNLIANYPQNQLKTPILKGIGKVQFYAKCKNLIAVIDDKSHLYFIRVYFNRMQEQYEVRVINHKPITFLANSDIKKYHYLSFLLHFCEQTIYYI